MGQKFSVILIDPPFAFNDKLNHSDVKRGAAANYSTMSIDELKALPIKDIADENGCLLALWVPSALLQDGLDIMKACGFSYRQTFIWVKIKQEPLDNFRKSFNKVAAVFSKNKDTKAKVSELKDLFVKAINDFSVKDVLSMYLGRLFRQSHEICLIGINNNKIYKKLENRSQRSVCFAQNLKHSQKPEELQSSLELMFPGTKMCEIFGRRLRPGWIVLGNESPMTYGEDIRVSLNKLINDVE